MKSKKLLTLLFAASIFISAQATVHTVSNNINSPGQYNNLQTCVNAASNGDTIYVEPSLNDYGNVTINKKLTLFGAGMDSRSYQLKQIAVIDNVYFTKNSAISTSSGSSLIGLYITSSVIPNEDTIFNITVARCYIGGYIEITSSGSIEANTNWLIVNNSIASQVYIYYASNNIISNNVLNSVYSTVNASSDLVNNNIFINSYGSAIINCDGLIIDNNIFYNLGNNPVPVLSANNEANTLNNNIAFNITGPVVASNNSGAGNILDIDPQFIAPPATMSFDSIISYNFNLPASSPGHLAGTDGTDIGIYGGAYPFQNIAGVTSLPQVILFNILNSSIPVNGTLNVTATGVTRN